MLADHDAPTQLLPIPVFDAGGSVLPMSRFKTITLALCAILVVIVALQNTDAVDTRLLFVTVSMPRALLLLVTLLIGIAVGLIVGRRIARRAEAARQPTS
jgi:uncharacterized integral membrane protein